MQTNSSLPLGKLNDDKYEISMLTASFRNQEMPLVFFFFDRYKQYPSKLIVNFEEVNYFSYQKAIDILKIEYNHETRNDVINYCQEKESGMIPSNHICDLGNGVFIYFDIQRFKKGIIDDINLDFIVSVVFLFLPNMKEFVGEFIFKLKCENTQDAKLKMICKNNNGFYLTEIDIKRPKITDIKIHYGEVFTEIHEKISTILKEPNSTGMVLLHGLPGTGKTHYIRYLIQSISAHKKLIYVPPDMAASISTPEFLPFMLEHKDSILIIEDAENIIKSRDSLSSSTQAVANLLNLSDGLLGDSLHQPIIATFNCELNSIDPALLRKGRLIAHHEFDKLSVESAQVLSDHLGFSTVITEPMVLAEIYGQDK